MLHSATLPVLLKQLRLSSMAAQCESYLDKATDQSWDPAMYLAALCEEELSQRHSRRIARNFKESRLPIGKTLSSFDFTLFPDLEKQKLRR